MPKTETDDVENRPASYLKDVLKDVPYHVTHRGNTRQQVFFEDRDYSLYQDLLRDHCQEAGLLIWGYCLVPNHIHLLAVPGCETAVA